MTRKFISKRIDGTVGASPITLIPISSSVYGVVITCSNAGTTWAMSIIDAHGKVLIPSFLLNIPVDGLPNVDRSFEDHPVTMKDGISVAWTGTPGVADLWIDAATNPLGSIVP
jgi:hypothetical protein